MLIKGTPRAKIAVQFSRIRSPLESEVAVIVRATSDEVHRFWTSSLLHLHDLWVKKRAVT